jgi:PAS domain S-box-containing protein
MSTALNHVLIVDPNESIRSEVSRLLSEAKVAPTRISLASSADDVLQACSAKPELRPTILLIALTLCGEHGDELLTALRGQQRYLTLPIVLLGEVDDDERIDIALTAGAKDYLLINELSSQRLYRVLERASLRHSRLMQVASDENYFRALVDSTPALIWGSDASKARNFFNRAWLQFTGRTLEQEVGDGWLESVHVEDREHVYQTYGDAFDKRIPFNLEYRLRRFDGVYRQVVVHGQPRYSLEGEFEGYTGSGVDVTERREAEEELRLNDERLRVVLKGSPITVMTVDRSLRYTWVHNPQSNFSVEEMVGKRDDDLFPPEIAQSFMHFKQEVLEKEVAIRREMDFNWNGQVELFDTRAEPSRDDEGNVVGMTIVAINITERVRREQRSQFLVQASELLSSSLDYETTLQQMAKSMVPVLADWCAVDILTDANEIEQVAVAHVDPNKVQWARKLRENNRPTMDDPAGVAAVLRSGKADFLPTIPQELIDEAIRNAKNDEQRQAIEMIAFKSAMTVPLITRSQVFGAITLVWSDSDRHYDQADLEFVEELARRAAIAIDHARLFGESQQRAEDFRQLSETLEQVVDERTKELRRSNQDLDQFAYIASHDLKAPLRAIDHLSTWVLEDVGHLLPDRSHEHLEKMRSRIKRMEGLLDDLLTYSRAGRFRGDATNVNTSEVVDRVIETVTPPEGFRIEVKGSLPTLHTYAAPLETVLRNLVSNAIKHHDKPQGKIEISAKVKGDFIEFSVADDGPGIDPAFHDRIFQMFQTLRPRDQVEGSGIGLAVVEKIISNVGGTIRLESAPNKGATFIFTWPLQYAP